MKGIHRVVNLELGMPAVRETLLRLETELNTAKRQGRPAVKFIHGYGSTGKGGKLRTAVRKELNARLKKGELGAVVPGEQWTIFDETSREVMRLCPSLRKDEDLERYNNGITLVLLTKLKKGGTA